MEESKNRDKGFKKFLLVMGLFIIIMMNENTQKSMSSLLKGMDKNSPKLELDIEYNGENLYYYKDTLIRWYDNKITYFNEDGSEESTKEFEFMNPDIYFGENIIYIMDKSSGDIYLMDEKGDTLSRVQIEGSIFNLIESNENLLVHSKGHQVENLFIFDKEGNNIESLQSNKNILTYSIDEKGNNYGYSTTTVNEEVFNSTVYVKNIDGEEEYSKELSNEVVIFIEFIDNRIVLLTDINLYLIGDGNIIWTYPYKGMQDILVKENEIYMLNNNILNVINLNGELKESVSLSIDTSRIIDLDKYIGVHGKKDLVVLQNNKEMVKYIGQDDIIEVAGNNESIAVHYTDKVDILKIINKQGVIK